ncbi:MAG: ABC transporter ATP-binding protein [Candidatus Njordarchaeia archaeon]
MSFLQLKNIWKSYGKQTVLRGLSLEVEKGKLVVILGPSGCGKTTTLRIIAGTLKPDKGKIVLDGNDITDFPPWMRNVGLVFQNLALFPHLNVWENIAFGLEARGWDREEAEERVSQLIELFKLNGLEDRYPRELSGGQQQRVAIARAIAPNPKILLMDEPFSNLDVLLREEMRIELKEILGRMGITTIFVTHDQNEAFQIADKLGILMNGKIVQFGEPIDIYKNPVNEDVAKFLKLNVITVSEKIYEYLNKEHGADQGLIGCKIIIDPLDIEVNLDNQGIPARVVFSDFQRHYWRILLELVDGQKIEMIAQKESLMKSRNVAINIKKYKLLEG